MTEMTKCRRRFPWPWSALVTLSWIILIKAFDPALFHSIQRESGQDREVYDAVETVLIVAFYLSLPILGLISDIKLGRINAVIVCVIIGAVSSITCIVVIAGFSNTTAGGTVMLMALTLTLYSKEVLRMVAFIIGTNQLIEMSCTSQQLSSYVWWYYWCDTLGAAITQVTSCPLHETYRSFSKYSTGIHLVQLVLILLSAIMIKKCVSNYSSRNPLKIINRILCFALKNKHPIERSALTYWEEDEPSRIDLGKTKYGGPFQEKDVESTKTFFRLIPVVAVVTMIQFPYQIIGRFVPGYMSTDLCLISGTYFVQYCTVIVTVPLYQLFLRRYCTFFVNVSMLKRVGLGIAVTAIAKLGYVVTDVYVSVTAFNSYSETVCIFKNNTKSVYADNIYLFLLPNIINSFGTLLIIPGSLEFVFAQASHSMQGLLIGLWYGIGGLYETAGYLMIEPFKSLSQYLVPSCELYVFIMNFLFMVACLMLFVKVSRWYKLHNHENVFNAHHIAENFYEKDFNRRDRYRDYGSMSYEVVDEF